MKPATPSTLRPANGRSTQDGKTELPPSTQLRKVVFGGTGFSLLCAASKKLFSARTACVTSLLPLLLLLTLPAVVQAQFNYTTNNGTITITGYTGYDPDASTRRSDPTTPGVDYSAYPRSRTYIAGINVTF